MSDIPWKPRGAWRLLVAPGREAAGFEETLTQLPYWIQKQAAPLVPPGRHRVDRLTLPCGRENLDVVVKTFAVQSAGRDRLAARRGSKAERAFRTALVLRAAGVGTPAPVAVAERWEGARLRASHLLTEFVPDLGSLRSELTRIYTRAPRCDLLMQLLQCAADAVRALHDAGVLHRDLGNQNLGLQPDPDHPAAPWKVYFLDLNRAHLVPDPSPADDFRRVFHAMYFHGHRPPPEFTAAERKARAAFDRHTAWRPIRHPLREARLRRAGRLAPPAIAGRDIWIWDDRSAQPIPAFTARDRRKLLPAANIAAAARSVLRQGLAIHWAYRRLLAQSFQAPVPVDGALGLTLDADPATWARQLEFLARLQGAHKLPLLLRLYHHLHPEAWHWTLDQALNLHRQGHSVALALVQDRRAVREPKGWRQMVTLAFDRAHTFADFFEIGHAVNRSKWGVWDYREYTRLLDPVRASLIQYPEARITGPAGIDFEPLALGGILERMPRDLPFQALSHHLYVDRRGAPENFQGPFDTVGKCALLRAYARTYGFADDRVIVSEVNWPLLGTGVWSPVTSPYETLHPRTNDPSVTEEQYAAFMLRYLLLTIASGHVSRVYWWRLAARGFGLVDDTDPAAWRARPAFFALQTLLPQLTGAVFARKPASPDGHFALEFTRPDGRPLTVRWKPDTLPEFA